MWTFLATESSFSAGFSWLTILYRLYTRRLCHRQPTDELALRTLNTAILLTSSLTMALAVITRGAGEQDQNSGRCLLLTLLFAFGFLVVKASSTTRTRGTTRSRPNFNAALPPRAGLFFCSTGP